MSKVFVDSGAAIMPIAGTLMGWKMQVPYAKQWRALMRDLAKVALDCGLAEESKWAKPCFTWKKKNVAIIIPLKEACAFSFFKGALLKDPKRILQKIGEHTQAGRWIKFTSSGEVASLRPELKRLLAEAIQVEESGRKVSRKQVSEYTVPAELQARLDATPKLKAAFDALTPGRRKSYILHVAGAKQAQTRVARVEKCMPAILAGRRFNEPAG